MAIIPIKIRAGEQFTINNRKVKKVKPLSKLKRRITLGGLNFSTHTLITKIMMEM